MPDSYSVFMTILQDWICLLEAGTVILQDQLEQLNASLSLLSLLTLNL